MTWKKNDTKEKGKRAFWKYLLYTVAKLICSLPAGSACCPRLTVFATKCITLFCCRFCCCKWRWCWWSPVYILWSPVTLETTFLFPSIVASTDAAPLSWSSGSWAVSSSWLLAVDVPTCIYVKYKNNSTWKKHTLSLCVCNSKHDIHTQSPYPSECQLRAFPHVTLVTSNFGLQQSLLT